MVTHNEKNITTSGTCFQGDVEIDYNTLVEIFGEPNKGDGYKVDAEWDVEFDDGTVATIYNYKDGKNYLGKDGLDVREIVDWHIGGFNRKSVDLVIDKINGNN